MEKSPLEMKPKRRPRAALALLGTAGLGIAVLLIVWWRLASEDPAIKIPTPVLPNPNAYDLYVAAGGSVVRIKQVEQAIALKPIKPITLEEKEALVQQNAKALQSLQQGFACEYHSPVIRSSVVPMAFYTDLRYLSEVLRLQGMVREGRGDWGGAADCALDAIQMGEDVQRGGGVNAHESGILYELRGQRPLWKTIDHLTAAQSRSAIQRLQSLIDRHFSYADAVREEKWTGLGVFQELFRGVKVRGAFSQVNGIVASTASSPQRLSAAYWLLCNKKRVVKDYIDYMDAIEAGVRQPYALKMLPPPAPTDPVNAVMQPLHPMLLNGRFSDMHSSLHNRMLLIALALHVYHLEHGRYPASLAELAPAYLQKLPDDLCAAQGSFHYLPKGQNYLLYSIGPDGKDNAGVPIDDPQNATRFNPLLRYRAQANSIGDIVAGINTP